MNIYRAHYESVAEFYQHKINMGVNTVEELNELIDGRNTARGIVAISPKDK